MKKTIILLALSAMFASCNNTAPNKPRPAIAGQTSGTAPLIIDSIATNEPYNWQNNLIDSGYADSMISYWNNQVIKLVPQDSTKPINMPVAFVVSANDLLHALNDSAGVSELVFYIGYDTTNGNNIAKLFYAPARFQTMTQNLNLIFYTNSAIISKVNGPTANGFVFDNTYPCPTCLVNSPNMGAFQMPTTPIILHAALTKRKTK